MGLKRYTKEELIPLLEGIAYKELANNKKVYDLQGVKAEKNIFEYSREQNIQFIKDMEDALVEFGRFAYAVHRPEDKDDFYRAMSLIEKEKDILKNSNLKNQKEEYKKSGNLYLTRTWAEYPLKGKINALYDDFSILVIFYDGISTLNNGNKFEQFMGITNEEDRIEFVKNNIEITHLSLVSTDHEGADISIYGSFRDEYTIKGKENTSLLESSYSDFNRVKLEDTMNIDNNDLRQLVQSKIDIDAEGLEVVDEKNVRGDIYKVLKHCVKSDEYVPGWIKEKPYDDGNTYYIRYVCPSTGRIYFNRLSDINLQKSKFYDKKDPVKSYIYCFWNLNTLGLDPTKGEDVIRC